MKAPTLIGGSVVSGMVGGISRMAGAPWGAVVAIAVIGLVCTLILGLVQTAIPQESHDKVEFWEKVFAYLERRRAAVPAKRPRPRRAIRASPEHDATVVTLPRSAPPSEQTLARSTARALTVSWRTVGGRGEWLLTHPPLPHAARAHLDPPPAKCRTASTSTTVLPKAAPPVKIAVGGLSSPAQANRPAAAPTSTAVKTATASQRPRAVGFVNAEPFGDGDQRALAAPLLPSWGTVQSG